MKDREKIDEKGYEDKEKKGKIRRMEEVKFEMEEIEEGEAEKEG